MQIYYPKVNTGIFKDIDKLMDNVFAVTSYLRGEIKKNGGDENRETLHFIKTKNGDKYYRTENGDCYRAYVFVSDSISYNSVDSPELFKQSGIAFGKFQRLLSDFPADSLYETIPNFHNTAYRFENEFMPAVEKIFRVARIPALMKSNLLLQEKISALALPI